MLTNRWNYSLVFLHLLFFIPRGFPDCCEESRSSNTGANFCFVSTLFLVILPPSGFLVSSTRGRTELIYHYSQTLPNVYNNSQHPTTVYSFRFYLQSFILHKNTMTTRGEHVLKGKCSQKFPLNLNYWGFIQQLFSFLTVKLPKGYWIHAYGGLGQSWRKPMTLRGPMASGSTWGNLQ